MLGFLKSSIVVVVAFISITARGNELLTCEYKVQDTYAYFQKNFPSLIVSGEKSLSLEEFSSLKQIMIGNLGFSDEDIPYICSLTQIESLSIYNDGSTEKLTGKNLGYLTFLTELAHLDLDGNNLVSEDLYKISSLPKLKSLKIGLGTKLSGSLAALDLIPTLKYLTFEANAGLTKESFSWLPEGKKVWDQIIVYGPQNLDDSVLGDFFAFAKVKTLILSAISLTNIDQLAAFSQNTYIKEIYLPMDNLKPEQVILAYEAIFKISGLSAADLRAIGYQEEIVKKITPNIKEIYIPLSKAETLAGEIEKRTDFIVINAASVMKINFTSEDYLESMDIIAYFQKNSLCESLKNKYSNLEITFTGALGSPGAQCN